MEPKTFKPGSSLPVPSVQELAKESMQSVPSRYIRFYQDIPNASPDPVVPDVPVVDMKLLLSEESMESEMAKLHSACTEWGFFQLVNHEVSSSLLAKMKVTVEEFFNLPKEEKKRFKQNPGKIEGFGQTFVVSEEQKLDWSDTFIMTTLPVHMRNPHLFPELPPSFREALEEYSLEMKRLNMCLLAYIAKAVKIEAEDIKDLFENGFQLTRINYYPPCPQPEKVIGLTPHSDGDALTILLQISEVEGLQIRKDGMWLPVKPLPNSFIVNLGDMLEVITNGAYRSIEHRAIVNSEKERLSIATFHSPRYDGEIRPLPSLVSEQKPAVFKGISVEDYYKEFFGRELYEKSHLDTLRIKPQEKEA